MRKPCAACGGNNFIARVRTIYKRIELKRSLWDKLLGNYPAKSKELGQKLMLACADCGHMRSEKFHDNERRKKELDNLGDIVVSMF
jgi:ribosomal protein L37E